MKVPNLLSRWHQRSITRKSHNARLNTILLETIKKQTIKKELIFVPRVVHIWCLFMVVVAFIFCCCYRQIAVFHISSQISDVSCVSVLRNIKSLSIFYWPHWTIFSTIQISAAPFFYFLSILFYFLLPLIIWVCICHFLRRSRWMKSFINKKY